MNEVKDIQNPFCIWLKKQGIPFHRQRSDKRPTGAVGDPDFIITLAGRVLYVEAKVLGKKPSPEQVERIGFLRSKGNQVVIAFSLQECVDAVTEWAGIVTNE